MRKGKDTLDIILYILIGVLTGLVTLFGLYITEIIKL